MSRYQKPTTQLGSGLGSILSAFDAQARNQLKAGERQFIEVADLDGRMHTCLIQRDLSPFDPDSELANEVELLVALIERARHRHNALPLINGIAHGMLGQRGHGFVTRLVEDGLLTTAELDDIRHAIDYDPEHPHNSPSMDIIRQAAMRLLPALRGYANRHGIELQQRRPSGQVRRGLQRYLCSLVRRLGLERFCLAGAAG